MIPLRSNHEISNLLSTTLSNSNAEEMDKMGLDIRNLGSGGSKEAKIKQIAIQFEQILLNALLKSAFKDKKDDPFGDIDNEEEKPILTFGPVNDFKIMLLSQHIADNGGLGYQQIIEQQIREKYLDAYEGNDDKNKNAGKPLTLKGLDSVRTVPAVDIHRTRAGTSTPAPTASSSTSSTGSKKTDQNPGATIVEPVETDSTSSDFGLRRDPFDGITRFHSGVDYDVPPKTPVKSFTSGEVVFSGWEQGYGKMVEVKHANGYTSRYGHLSKLKVKVGDKVEAGALLGLSGSTGRSTGPHLHFEIRKEKIALNPARFFKQNNFNVLAKNSDIKNVSTEEE